MLDDTFCAFISYSHEDESQARRLQSDLERYTLPKGLEADLNEASGRRLGKFFRDRSDFAAATDLSEAIEAALQRSQSLIVLCSPRSKRSEWVQREIEFFRRIHPNRPILLALIDGEPEESFPEILLAEKEPLAADLRTTGDGWKTGTLKIIAGLIDQPLHVLVDRDSQRRLRRVTAITLGSLALALAMSAMTVVTAQSRAKALFQHQETESLVEYTLTDMRTDLESAGRLELMRKVHERVLKYYKAQGPLSGLADESLATRSRVLNAMGSVEHKLCNWDRALLLFREAHRTTSRLVTRNPSDPDQIFAHAQSEYYVGFAAWQTDDYETVEEAWRGYLKQANDLSQIDPGAVTSLQELGFANGNMCEVLTVQDPTSEVGIKHCQQAVSHFEQVVKLQPNDTSAKLNLANRHGWLADALRGAGELDQARGQREIEADLIAEVLEQEPENVLARFRQTFAAIGIGEIHQDKGEMQEALARFSEADGGLAQLLDEIGTNSEVSEVRIRVLLLMAKVKQAAGILGSEQDRQTARALFDASEAIGECAAFRRFDKEI